MIDKILNAKLGDVFIVNDTFSLTKTKQFSNEWIVDSNAKNAKSKSADVVGLNLKTNDMFIGMIQIHQNDDLEHSKEIAFLLETKNDSIVAGRNIVSVKDIANE